jgi:hypothetical protein
MKARNPVPRHQQRRYLRFAYAIYFGVILACIIAYEIWKVR